MEPIRLGIVGPGLIWENAHRPALEGLDPGTFTLRAFSGRSQASRDKVARDYPDAAFHHDYHDLVARDDVDAVVVLTPILLNAPVAMAALAAGKDVYLEKPMASSLAEGLELAARAEEAGRHVFIIEQSAYRAAYRVARERIAAGDIGEPVTYEWASHGLFDAGAHSMRGYGTRLAPAARFPRHAVRWLLPPNSPPSPRCSAPPPWWRTATTSARLRRVRRGPHAVRHPAICGCSYWTISVASGTICSSGTRGPAFDAAG